MTDRAHPDLAPASEHTPAATGHAPTGQAEFDHLVVVVADLDAAAQQFAQLTGVVPLPGGKHARMGTHNRLVPLVGGGYLELIAVDPNADPNAEPNAALNEDPGAASNAALSAANTRTPATCRPRPRWFGMDHPIAAAPDNPAPNPSPSNPHSTTHSPTDAIPGLDLRHWVIRPPQPASEAVDAPEAAWDDANTPGPVIAMQRGDNRWTLTIRADGQLPFAGAQPSLIRWQTPHPRQKMGQAQITLRGLTLQVDDPLAFETRLRRGQAWPADLPLQLQSVRTGRSKGLIAELATPRGTVWLCSATMLQPTPL